MDGSAGLTSGIERSLNTRKEVTVEYFAGLVRQKHFRYEKEGWGGFR
jgi:hypothetical protein